MEQDITVVSGSYGAGHDAAADALAGELRAAGHVVRRLDVADELPWRTGVLLRWLFLTQLQLAPASWGTTLSCLEQGGRVADAVPRALGLLGRRLVRRVETSSLVISTHPIASQVLGEARAAGRLSTPVVTYLTDASVHRLWVHPAVDLHLAFHEVAADQARALGAVAAVVRPAVSPVAGSPRGCPVPWPPERPAALLVGGSCGIGDLEASALDVLATGLLTPVVACGTNARLHERLSCVPGVVALGWRSDLAALVGAASCVVQNAGGMTSLESLAAGTPTLTYRPIPGHGTTNAAALAAAGLVPWVQGFEELGPALARVLLQPHPARLPTASQPVLDVLRAHELLVTPPALVAA